MQSYTLDQPLNPISDQYSAALEEFLSGGGEEVLRRAYELGRAAMEHGSGLLDVIDLHRAAMDSLVPLLPPDAIDQLTLDSIIFLKEALSPFEITHRGYWDAVELKQHVTQFASVATHEVKAPLSAILCSAGMLQQILAADQNSSAGKLLSTVLNGAAILRARTNDMTDIASLYSGSLRTNIQRVDAAKFIKAVCHQLKPELREHGMTLKLDIAATLPPVEFDPVRIEQVITNLVQNAIKYASAGGRIDVKIFARGGSLSIQVRDYGPGLSPEKQGWLASKESSHNRYVRADGTGLGLMLCKQLVEAHHGQLTGKSRPGKGCTFNVTLPLKRMVAGGGRLLESAHR